jgi:hypothetical protein
MGLASFAFFAFFADHYSFYVISKALCLIHATAIYKQFAFISVHLRTKLLTFASLR